MLCENCNENKANVRYTQIVNGVKKEMHLCDECAAKLGIGGMDFNFDMPFSGFFEDLLNDYDVMPTIAMPKPVLCDKCGLSFDEFVEDGKFGCDNCYTVFENKIDPILKRLHGSSKYVGRKATLNEENNIMHEQSKIESLKRELKQKIKEEKYEEAAKLRDEIKRLGGK